MKVQEILDELKYIGDGTFPGRALSQAIVKRDEILPHLLRVLEQSKDQPEKIIAQPGYILHVYALFLLAQFRERRAYDSIVELVSLPAQQVDDLLGDIVTESLMRILASVGAGDTERLRSLVENRAISPYVRGAALYTFVVLVARKLITREEAIDYFRSLLQTRLERKRGHLWVVLISCCLDIYAQELRTDIKNAYLSNLVDNKLIGEFSVVQNTFAESKNTILTELEVNPQYQLVNDTVAELRRWAAFNKPEDQTVKMKKVGRNMPCPCGSGKKYKHCCLRNAAAQGGLNNV